MSKLHICLVCPYSFDLPGGVQNQVLGLSRALTRAGYRSSVIGPGVRAEGPKVFGEIELVGASLSVPVNGSRAPIAPFPAAMRATSLALGRLAPDVVHIHEPFVPGPSLAALYRSSAPRIGTFHRAGAGRLYRSLGPLARRMLVQLDALTAVSEEASQTLQQVIGGSASVEVLFNGVELGRFSPAPSGSRDGRQIVFLGRLEERKGVAVLLEAFSLLAPGPHLLVIGDGPGRASLAQHAAGRDAVRFLGRLDDAEVAEVLASSSLLIAPSLFGESFGVVLIEAMAAGAAVIASDLPGYRIAGGEVAQYVPPGDAPALARSIEQILKDQSRLALLREQGQERAIAFSFDALVARYGPIYQRVLQRR